MEGEGLGELAVLEGEYDMSRRRLFFVGGF
jgi:hypothetical protein